MTIDINKFLFLFDTFMVIRQSPNNINSVTICVIALSKYLLYCTKNETVH